LRAEAVLAELDRRMWMGNLSAAGHRVAHGGEFISASVVITPRVIIDIEACSHLAPLHNPPALLVIRRAIERMPTIPHVAVGLSEGCDSSFGLTTKKMMKNNKLWFLFGVPNKAKMRTTT
jgi:acetate kinase